MLATSKAYKGLFSKNIIPDSVRESHVGIMDIRILR